MENNIKVSPSHELLEELKTAVFNCDIEAVESGLDTISSGLPSIL